MSGETATDIGPSDNHYDFVADFVGASKRLEKQIAQEADTRDPERACSEDSVPSLSALEQLHVLLDGTRTPEELAAAVSLLMTALAASGSTRRAETISQWLAYAQGLLSRSRDARPRPGPAVPAPSNAPPRLQPRPGAASVLSVSRAVAVKGAGRVPGQRPSLWDLERVVFVPTSAFEVGEVVAVPQSRGGFVYATVERRAHAHDRCYLDGATQHASPRCRVVYPSQSTPSSMLFKDLPPHYIGKLPALGPAVDSAHNAPPVALLKRTVGARVHPADLATVVLSASASFVPGTVVAIPRSSGGFSYGEVVDRHASMCTMDRTAPAHQVVGWRVLVSPVGAQRVVKDLPAGAIGHLVLIDAAAPPPPRPATAILAPRPLSITRQPAQQQQQEGDSADELRATTTPEEAEAEAEGEDEDDSSSSSEEDVVVAGALAPRRRASHDEDEGSDMDEVVWAGHENDSDSDSETEDEDESAATTRTSSAGAAATPRSPAAAATPSPPPAAAAAARTATPPAAAPPATAARAATPPAAPAAAAEPKTTPRKNATPPSPGRQEAAATPPRACAEPQSQAQASGGGRAQRARGGVLYLELPQLAAMKAKANKPLIVLDGPNIGMRHGRKNFLSVVGIRTALQYWLSRGHDTVAFVPEHFATRKKAATSTAFTLSDFMPRVDDAELLDRLVAQQLVVLTPPQDYDDSYSIQYARSHPPACIVTNDRFWDHIEKLEGAARQSTLAWIRSHCISFTFVRDEFLPNPDFVFPDGSVQDDVARVQNRRPRRKPV
eukprot:m51a1_g14530 hypothetical protein (779) ;mRNA; r:930818-933662